MASTSSPIRVSEPSKASIDSFRAVFFLGHQLCYSLALVLAQQLQTARLANSDHNHLGWASSQDRLLNSQKRDCGAGVLAICHQHQLGAFRFGARSVSTVFQRFESPFQSIVQRSSAPSFPAVTEAAQRDLLTAWGQGHCQPHIIVKISTAKPVVNETAPLDFAQRPFCSLELLP